MCTPSPPPKASPSCCLAPSPSFCLSLSTQLLPQTIPQLLPQTIPQLLPQTIPQLLPLAIPQLLPLAILPAVACRQLLISGLMSSHLFKIPRQPHLRVGCGQHGGGGQDAVGELQQQQQQLHHRTLCSLGQCLHLAAPPGTVSPRGGCQKLIASQCQHGGCEKERAFPLQRK